MKERADCKSTKPKVSAQKDIVEVFWKKYIGSDSLQRRKMLKKIVPTFSEVVSIEDKELREKVLLTSLQGYFDDLICVINKVEEELNPMSKEEK